MSTAACPESQHLRQLLDDSLVAGEVEKLTQHLGHCTTCQQVLERLAAGDPTLLQVVAVSAHGKPAPESAYWHALRDLEQIATRTTPAPSATPMPEFDPRSSKFLDPPIQAGNLGRLGRFEILRVIGQGGMGVVLQAHDADLQREVAIKVLDPRLASDVNARQRFCREARAAAAVSDDHIVAVHQVAPEDQELPYFVMQLVEGESLEDRLSREKRLSTSEIVRIGRQVASGLAAAHERGMIHRDIKPGNILLEKGTDRVKITDFGLARAAEDLRLTRSGMVAGTPLYMAPEQARGEELDHRADLFSLGVVLYEMATGAPPFVGPTPLAVLRRLSDEPHRPLAEAAPDLPEWLSEVIDRLLEKRPEDRFQTAREVAQLLEERWLLMRTSSSEHIICPRSKARQKMVQLTAIGVIGGVLLTLAAMGLFRLLRPSIPVTTPWATLGGNQDPIWSVANSPDGKLVAIGTTNEGVKLWDPRDDRLEATFPSNRPVWCVSFSRNGKLLAVASEEGLVRIYDLETQKIQQTLEHASGVKSVSMTRDGSKMVTGTRNGVVTLWDLNTGKRLLESEAHRSVFRVAFSPDDRNYASCGEDGRVILWDTTARKQRLEIPNQGGALWALAFSPDGKLLATGGWDGVVRLWETGSGKPRTELKGNMQDVWALSFCPSGKLLAIGSEDGAIRIWNVEDEQERATLHGHKRTVYTLSITPDGKNLVSGSRDGSVLMWTIPARCGE